MTTATSNIMRAAPDDLKTRPQWVCWKRELREGKPTKIPYRWDGKGMASTTDLVTWGSFEAAIEAYATRGYDGIGYVFNAADPFAGIDLDHCRDAETGAIEPWAARVVAALNSYTEITPSCTGLHIILKGRIPPGGNRKGPIEMYDHSRYFTVTGDHLEGTPATIEDRQQELSELHASIITQATAKMEREAKPVNLGDAELIQRAMSARNGEAFTRLWNGDTADHDGDDSAADLALCSHLAFWTNKDAARMDALFRQSGLYRGKWNRNDYSMRTISKACGNGIYRSISKEGVWGGENRGTEQIGSSDTKTGRGRDENGTRGDEAGREGTSGTSGTNGTMSSCKIAQRGGKATLREWVNTVDGTFDVKTAWAELGVSTPDDRHYFRKLLRELIAEGVIASTNKDGFYRKLENELVPLDWQNADTSNTISIKFPFDIHKYCKIYPRSIIVVAGSKNAGKTAFLYNVVADNMNGPLKLDLFNSETGPEQMKERMAAFNVPTPAPFNTYQRYDHFSDVIHPEHLSVIDYLDMNSEVYLVGSEIDAIFRKLTTGVAIIGIQKAPPIVTFVKGVKRLEDRDLGYGGAFSAKRAVLYVSMGSGRVKLVYVKTPANPKVNPNNKCWTFSYDEDGVHFKNNRESFEGESADMEV